MIFNQKNIQNKKYYPEIIKKSISFDERIILQSYGK